ncbi:MAG: PAS domain S-box protein, partial [Thiobacillus sp.]|nr:PAS domain S-box protein [Thiobacillus sp.]
MEKLTQSDANPKAEKPSRGNAETLLAESHARYKAIFETVVDGIVTIDERGRIDAFNPAAERIFGYRADEVIGRNVSMLMPEPYHSAHDGYLASYLRTGRTGVIGIGREVTGLRKDGSTFPMDLAVAEESIAGRRHFNGIVRDISEQHQAREKLQRFGSEMQAIFTLSPDGFVALDERGRVTYANPAFLALTGAAVGSLQGLGEDDLDARLATLCESGYELAPTAAMPDGASDVLHLARPRPAVLKRSVRRIRGEGGRSLGRVLYFRDITSEMELQRMKSEFLA